MSKHCLTSAAQVSFAERVLVFIHELFCKVIPSRKQLSSISEIIRRFHLQVDTSFEELDRLGADDHEYRVAVGGIAYDEVLELCSLMRAACAYSGFSAIAERYLNAVRFATLIYDMNEEKLASLNAVIHGGCDDVGEIMMRVSAVLDGQPGRYDVLDAAAKRKATKDVERIAATVETLSGDVVALHRKVDRQGKEIVSKMELVREDIHVAKEELLARVNGVVGKMGVGFGGKRNGKHTPRQKAVCQACWEIAQRDLKDSTKGKVTREMAFRHCASVLEDYGIRTFKKFRAVLLTNTSTRSAANIKALEAKIEAERKAKMPR